VTTIREAIKSCLETNWSLGTTPTFHDVLTEEDLQAVLAAKDDVVWIYPYQRSPYEVVNVNYRHRHEYYEIGVQSRTSDDEAEGFRDEVLRILTASGAITGVDMILPLWKTDLSDRKKHIYKHVITFDVVVLAETSSGSVTPSSTSNADLSQRTYVTISDESGTLPNSVQHANITSQSELHAPKLHAASHENGGSDEIDVSGLSGELADPQPPKAHASSHESGGSDELSLDASQITSGTIDSARLPTITDAMVNDDITITNITQITNRDHGDLQGLTDDDHTQYVKVDGTRSMTGALDTTGLKISATTVIDGNRDATFDSITVKEETANTDTYIYFDSNSTAKGPYVQWRKNSDSNYMLQIHYDPNNNIGTYTAKNNGADGDHYFHDNIYYDGSIASFDEYDDIALLKAVKTNKKEKGKLVVDKDTLHPEIKSPDGLVKVGALQGFLLCTLKKLVERVEQLEAYILKKEAGK